jgi:hypothetical protein
LARSLIYVGKTRGGVDERGFAAIRGLRVFQHDRPRLTLSQFKAVVREQFFMLLIDEEAALAAIPDLLPADREERRNLFSVLCQVLSAREKLSGQASERLIYLAKLFDVDANLAKDALAAEPENAKMRKAS